MSKTRKEKEAELKSHPLFKLSDRISDFGFWSVLLLIGFAAVVNLGRVATDFVSCTTTAAGDCFEYALGAPSRAADAETARNQASYDALVAETKFLRSTPKEEMTGEQRFKLWMKDFAPWAILGSFSLIVVGGVVEYVLKRRKRVHEPG